ncbi:MAG TPA: hypothetical protein VJ983_00120 [candidate division Zixibacteria bacterium]|nr:hypothetical protein [candidate division Zixibacteria bacterium]
MKLKLFLSTALLCVIAAGASVADVVIHRKTTIDNLFGLGSTTTTETDYVKPDMIYTSNETDFNSKFSKIAPHAQQSKQATIIRLDKGLMQHLDLSTKTYRETDLDMVKMMSDSSRAMMSQMQQSMADSMAPGSMMPGDQDFVWTFDVTTDPKTTKVNGFTCKHVTAKATGVSKSDSTHKTIITSDEWLAQDDPALDEMKTYQQNYARLVGIDPELEGRSWYASLPGYGPQLSELSDKLKDVKGYPIKTAVVMETTTSSDADSTDATSGTDQNAAMQQAMKKLSGMFGKKDDEDKGSSSGHPGFEKMFSFTSEILSAEKKDIPDSQFAVPSDFVQITD